MKNHADVQEKEFLRKSISKSYGRATAMPPARELIAVIPRQKVLKNEPFGKF